MTSSVIQLNHVNQLNSIQSCIAEEMHAVNTVIEQSLHSEVTLVNQVANYIVNSGGKRLRPMLVLLSAGLFGHIKPEHHQLAAVVEFIHTATLQMCIRDSSCSAQMIGQPLLARGRFHLCGFQMCADYLTCA